ncbi:CDP-alcohol phosphatidyltransferase family protein [Streptomyces sp. NBC_00435]|uniref:CDP-alcohol phosphatidyltransferase family protein n=1 Tax=Streptomyces sp. NBC_00435 TaxID=2903649 RepID=UPI002E1E1471
MHAPAQDAGPPHTKARTSLSVKEVRRIACKERDAWWTVALVDPLAVPLVRWTDRHTRITPDQVTWAAFLVGLGAAACFAQGTRNWLAVGALLYHASFVLDCVDGKLARLQGSGSLFGGWLDFMLDRLRVMCCTVALFGAQWVLRDDPRYLLLALAVVFLDMFRYLDSTKVNQVRADMRAQVSGHPAFEETAPPVFIEHLQRDRRQRGADLPPPEGEVIDLHEEFRGTYPWYLTARDFLMRSRIRPHLISGVEFQMAVFIVGPAAGHLAAPVAVAGIGLLVFEVFVVHKLLLSTRDFTQTMRRLDAVPPPRGPVEGPLRDSTGADAGACAAAVAG